MEKPEVKRPFRRTVDGRILLKRLLKKWDGRFWTGLMCFRIRIFGGCFV
jgi:hypothetical protein